MNLIELTSNGDPNKVYLVRLVLFLFYWILLTCRFRSSVMRDIWIFFLPMLAIFVAEQCFLYKIFFDFLKTKLCVCVCVCDLQTIFTSYSFFFLLQFSRWNLQKTGFLYVQGKVSIACLWGLLLWLISSSGLIKNVCF